MKRTLSVAFAAALVLALLGNASAESARGRRALPTKRIDLSLHDADIRNVLRLFAEVGDVNIVYGEDVTGTVTLHLKRVRWDHALNAILHSKGLEMAWQDNIIRVAKAESFAREREQEIDIRDHCLKTSPLQTRLIRVSHGRAEDYVPHIEASLSERGSVTIDQRTNTLIVRDVSCPR